MQLGTPLVASSCEGFEGEGEGGDDADSYDDSRDSGDGYGTGSSRAGSPFLSVSPGRLTLAVQRFLGEDSEHDLTFPDDLEDRLMVEWDKKKKRGNAGGLTEVQAVARSILLAAQILAAPKLRGQEALADAVRNLNQLFCGKYSPKKLGGTSLKLAGDVRLA